MNEDAGCVLLTHTLSLVSVCEHKLQHATEATHALTFLEDGIFLVPSDFTASLTREAFRGAAKMTPCVSMGASHRSVKHVVAERGFVCMTCVRR